MRSGTETSLRFDPEGFEVDAFVAGGDGTARAGRDVRAGIQAMLDSMDVPYRQDPLSSGAASQLLSATIEHGGEITYDNFQDGY